MFIRHSTPSNSKWDEKKNKKTPTQDYYWTNKKNLNIHLFAGINKWIYSVSYLERHLNINKQTPSVRQIHYQWRTHFFFFRKALYIHVASCGKVSFPASHAKKPICSKNVQTENLHGSVSMAQCIYTLLWTKKCITKTQCGCVQYRLPKGLYLARSSRNVQNHCRLYIHCINISREVTNRTSILLDPFTRLCMFAIYYIFVNNTHPIKQLASITFFSV